MPASEEVENTHREKKPGIPGSSGGVRNFSKRKEYGLASLTEKERIFLGEYLKTGNGTRAAMKAYDVSSYYSAQSYASQVLKRLKNPIKAYVEAHDFGLQDLFTAMKEGIKASKTEKVGAGRYAEVPDHAVREKFLRHASKWLEVPTAPELDIEGQGGIIVNVVESSLRDGAKHRKSTPNE